jgi:hypothetical protein
MADETLTLDPATGLTGGDLRRAALTVCRFATDVDDARDLLEALGLTDDLRRSEAAAG